MLSTVFVICWPADIAAQSADVNAPAPLQGRGVRQEGRATAGSAEYQKVQQRLAQGWNTWDVNSVMTQVLLPEGLAIHVGLKHNATEWGDAFLRNALIGRLGAEDEKVVPGPHAWDGSYSELRISWKGHDWRMQSAREGSDLVVLATPLRATSAAGEGRSRLAPTIVFSVNFLWNRPGTTVRHADFIETRGASGYVPIYCTCTRSEEKDAPPVVDVPVDGPYFAADLNGPVGVSTGRFRSVEDIQAAIGRGYAEYRRSLAPGETGPIVDAIETTLGWDTIYEPDKKRVVSPVSRVWSVAWGGYVIFDWDTFFAATMAGIGDKDLAYADAIETLREETDRGFVPNYARPGGWKSFDRSEPPVGAITVLGLYQKFHDRWLLEEAFEPLMAWNRWWSEHRDDNGYLVWGSDGQNLPGNLEDSSSGTREGAILESGLDNSPMYDSATYNAQTHRLEFADVGLMSLYIADCDALNEIARVLEREDETEEVRARGVRYRTKLATLWDEKTGIFLNKDLHTGELSHRLSPTNFYPMLANAASVTQVHTMVERHLRNPKEFWGEWVIPSIARDDPAFGDQNYWRGRIWGPMNYLVYLGLSKYDDAATRKELAQKSYDLFLKEWSEQGHVHENYNAITGSGDDVANSDRFYHWGALLGYVQYLEQSRAADVSAGSR